MSLNADPALRTMQVLDRELTALKAVAMACTEAVDEDELFQRVTDIICGTIQLSNFGIALYRAESGLLVDHSSARRGGRVHQEQQRLGEGIIGLAAQGGKPLRVADVRSMPGYWAEDPDTRSELAVPMLVRDQLIGVLNSESRELDAFTEADERLLVILAGQLAAAVARLRIILALREREENYRALFNSVPVALYQTTPEGRLVNANSAYLELVGAASLAELKDWNVTAGYLDPGERAVWCRDLEAQGEIHRETQWLRRDGTPFWVDERARVRRDAQGFLSYDGSALDITERKLAEAEGATLRARLLHSEKFEAIGHLAGGVAHDFNNQLTAIMGFGETLEETLENEQQKRFVRNIMRACQRSADLTRKLLAFARKGIVLSEPVDMHEIIREVVGLLKHSLDKRITLQTRCGASRRVVMGDPTQLQNALMNLAINARDAMPEGGTLAFETSVLTLDEDYCRAMPYEIEPGVYLQLVVADSGVGMAAETLDHIFEPFFTTKELGKGTGLGLASVYGTIKQHNGYIQAQSALDQGSRFNIFLPLSDVPMAKPIPPTPLEPHRGSGHILFVDDEALVAEVASEILTNLKYQVTLCRDGQEAVEFYATAWEAVDLVILDMVMPRMGGKDTFHALRQINPGVKVLIVSGFSIEGEAQQLLNAGALGFLQKPYRSVELVKEVAKALGRT